MKLVTFNGKAEGMRVRANLARVSPKASQLFITNSMVSKFLANELQLDFETAKIILQADKSVQYIERFVRSKIPVKKADHIIALLCIYSEDSLGLRILGDDFSDYIEELQDRLDECASHNYNGVLSSVHVIDFIITSNFLEGKPLDVCFLLYNLFLQKEGLALILDDTDVGSVETITKIKYMVSEYASTLTR